MTSPIIRSKFVAISACPSCGTNLKVPDGTVATVRCPKCQTVFQSKPGAAPPPMRPVPPKPAQPEFEVVNDEPHRSSRRDRNDRDDDRPRRNRRDDDDDDDRP